MLASSLEGGSLFEALQEGKLRLQQRSTFTSEKKKQTLQQLSFLPVPLLCMIEITNEYIHIFLMRSQTGKVYLPLWNNQQNWELLALTAAFCPLFISVTDIFNLQNTCKSNLHKPCQGVSWGSFNMEKLMLSPLSVEVHAGFEPHIAGDLFLLLHITQR